MVVDRVSMVIAKKHNLRAYLQARCIDGDMKKLKLLVEVTEKQSPKYKAIISNILQKCQDKLGGGLKYSALKALARAQRTELLG